MRRIRGATQLTLSLAVAASGAMALAPLPAAAQEPPDIPEVLLTDPQPRGGRVAGAAELDGQPGAELLLTSLSGGFSAVRGDGSVLWRYPVTTWSRPRLMPDVTGDGRPDVAAQIGFPGTDGELVLLSGATGELQWRHAVHSPHASIGVGDLNGDGTPDLVTPSVDGAIHIRAFFGPGFSTGWTATLPGTMNAYYVFAESLDVGNIDADPAAEVVFGTRQAANAGGAVFALDGATGATMWSENTGSVFGVKAAGGRVTALVWQSAAVTFRAELIGWSGAGGAPTWTLPLPAHLKTAEMITGDVDGDAQPEVIVGTTAAQEGTMLFGLDPSTAVVYAVGVADGRPRWASKVNRELSSLAAVPRAGGGVDIAYGTDAWISSSSDEQVGLLSGQTGALQWLHLRGSETHDDGIRGIAHADVNGDGQPEVTFGVTDQKVVALAPSDGAVRFTRAYPGVWTAADAGDLDGDGRVDLVGGGAEGLVRAVRDDGSVRWQAQVGGIIGGVRISPEQILVVSLSSNARVISLDPATGAQRWSFTTDVNANNPFGTHQQAFGDVDQDGRDDVIVGGDLNLRPTVVAVSAATGRLLWRSISPLQPIGQQPVTWAGSVSAVSVIGDDVFAYFRPLDSREPQTPRLALLNGVGGAPMWTSTATRGDVDAAVTRAGDTILVAFGHRYVSARRISDGTEAWSLDLGAEHLFAPVGDRVVAIARRSGLQKTLTGTVLGPGGSVAAFDDPSLPGPLAAGTVNGAGVVLSTREGVYVFDADRLATGQLHGGRQVRLIDYTASNGERFDIPSTAQLVGARLGTRTFVAGLQDRRHLTGAGGEAPGMWVARLLAPPTP